MKINIVEILENTKWWKREPATEEEISLLEKSFGKNLPPDYIALLRFSNGASLYDFVTPLTVFSISEVLALYKEFDLYANIPHSLIFGGDGGGTIYTYDLRDEHKPVLFFREDDTRYESNIYKADTLSQMVSEIVNNKKLN